jgi:O-antigen ligase
VKAAKENPILGVGSSNAALFLLSTSDPEETSGFASRPFSLPVQILIEKGIVGLGIYVVFVLLFCIEFHRSMLSRQFPNIESRHLSKRAMREREQLDATQSAYKAMKCCFAAGLIAVLFRELTYSSLFEHTVTMVLTLMLAALAIARKGGTA